MVLIVKGKMRRIFGFIVLVGDWCMSKDLVNAKLRALIKAYLVFNRGRKVSSKDISDWINGEYFGLNRSLVNARVVGHLLSKGVYNRNHIFYEVECETVNGRKQYWVN